MSQVKLVCGEALEVLKSMPDASVDSIVTDPPAGVSFMNSAFDSPDAYGTDGDTDREKFVAYLTPILRECLRVLKPGGHAFVWALPRTSHWTGWAVESAGFEVRDCFTHLFGCLDEQTEIMVDGAWRRWNEVRSGQRALAFDLQRGTFQWELVQDHLVYDYEGTAFRVHGDRTDQVLSRGHRCVVERDGAWAFSDVELVARQCEARVPVVEDVRELLHNLPLQDQGTGSEEQDLLLRMCRGAYGSCLAGEVQAAPADLHALRNGVSHPVSQEGEGAEILFLRMCGTSTSGQPEGTRPSTVHCADGSCRVDSHEPHELPHEDVRSEQSSVARRGNARMQEGQLRLDQVHSLPTGVPEHGAEGWLCNGPQSGRGTGAWTGIAAGGSSTPCGPQPAKQQLGESDALREQSGPQALRGSGYTAADLARIEPCEYRGVMWCIRLPSGAFLARRNGRAFVTGNSGFPKSLDIGKAIDEAAGVDRKVTGYDASRARPNRHYEAGALGNIGGSGTVSDRTDNGATLTAVASEAARRHDGSGSAVKPASEHWWLAQRPLAPVTATQIRAATGWDWWYTARDRPANTPAERLKWKKRGFVVPPPWREGTLIVSKRRALHAGVQSGVFLEWAPVRQDRDRPEAARLLGVADAKAWREWSSSTIAANILVHGTGGLQIDRCRVPFASDADFASAAPEGRATSKPGALAGGTENDGERCRFQPGARKPGRYPANLLLSHSPGCRRLGSVLSTRDGHWPAMRRNKTTNLRTRGAYKPMDGLDNRRTTEDLVAVWDCESGCAVETLDGQSGDRPGFSGGGTRGAGFRNEYVGGVQHDKVLSAQTYSDNGGASRFFSTFECEPRCPVAALDAQSGPAGAAAPASSPLGVGRADHGVYNARTKGFRADGEGSAFYGDAGGASRFFSTFACEPGCPVAALDMQSGYLTSGTGAVRHASGSDAEGNTGAAYGKESRPAGTPMLCYGDAGGASRFFTQLEVPFLYQAKPSRSERERGCDHLRGRKEDGVGVRNHHPCVKSSALMSHLCRLITPPGGTVLDPFCGSGSTGIAAVQEGFDFIGVEREPQYHAIAEARIKHALSTVPKLKAPALYECAPGCAVSELDRQSGSSLSAGGSRGAGGQHGSYSAIGAQPAVTPGYGDVGGASRFFTTLDAPSAPAWPPESSPVPVVEVASPVEAPGAGGAPPLRKQRTLLEFLAEMRGG